jgi:hypothetical protein
VLAAKSPGTPPAPAGKTGSRPKPIGPVPPLSDAQIQIFQTELLFQCKVLLAANDDLERVIREWFRIMREPPPPRGDPNSPNELRDWGRAAQKQQRENGILIANTVEQIWGALQQLLGAAANISRLLWSGDPQGKSTQREASRGALRASIGATHSLALKDRALRNHWEHIDEYIEEWWSATTRHWFIHRNISDGGTSTGIDEMEQFLDFNTTTKTVTFWGYVARVPSLVDEARTLEGRLEAILKTEWWRYV